MDAAVPHEVCRITVVDGVAWVRIDNPPTNLVDGAFIGALVGVLERAERDDDIRVLVFESADPDFFLMHGDVHGILAMPASDGAPVTTPNAAAAFFERLHRSPLVTIGVLDGYARGGGAELLAALDYRIASDRSVLGQPEVPMGILPGAGGTARLARLLGRGRALEVILSGRDVAADEACAIGWIDEVVPADRLDARVVELATRLSSAPMESIVAVKRVLDASLGGLDAALTAESAELTRLTDAGHHREPMTRFLAAGGQTRATEAGPIDPLLDAMRRADG